MITFETMNELTLKVNCSGSDVLFAKAGAFIGGESMNGKNYKFEKMLLGPHQGGVMRGVLNSMARRVTGENLPIMKVSLMGDSTTYYADRGQHIIAYRLEQNEQIYVESENLLAFTQDCEYNVRFLGCGVVSQKGLATSCLTGRGPNAYVAVTSNGNPLILSNAQSRSTLVADPDAVVCWTGWNGCNCDPQIKADVNWKTFIGQASGESYTFEWGGNQCVTVIVQPFERGGGISVSID